MISHLSHTSPIFRDDNAQVYHYLEEATRSTIYSSSLKPFQQTKNGSGAYLELMSQHAGNDKWEKELKQHEEFIKSRVLWDYCTERRARIHNLTPKSLFQLEGQNSHSATLGDEGDISNLCIFGWYEW